MSHQGPVKSGWALALKLGLRELRGGLAGFRILIACLAIGTAAIAAVGSISLSVTAGLDRDARGLLGGDVSIRKTHQQIDADHLAYIKETSLDQSQSLEMRAMAARADQPQKRTLVELKAVDQAYPLAGSFRFDPPGRLVDALAQGPDGAWGALAETALMAKLDLKPGDRVRLGNALIEIRAVIDREPDRVASVLSFGPRLMVAFGAAEASNLILPGSQIRYATRLLVKDGVNPKDWITDFRNEFPKTGYRVQSAEDAAPGVRRFIDRLHLFLTFVGLTAVLVGGIGVGNAVAAYMAGRLGNIATYKSLGAPTDLIVRIYLVQIGLLGTLGVFIGIIIGALGPMAALSATADLFPVRPVIGFYPLPLALAAAFGMVVAWTFSLWPLGQASRVKPQSLFRAAILPVSTRPANKIVLLLAMGLFLLASLTFVATNNPFFAFWFIVGSFISFFVLRLAASAVRFLASKIPTGDRAALRLVLANLHRPGNATASVMLSVGLGLSVLIAVGLLESNLNRQIDDEMPERAPSFFFLDIQPDQMEAFDRAIASVASYRDYQRVPSLRGRIVEIDGVAVDNVDVAEESRWAIRGDRALTYASEPRASSKIVAGDWWPKDYSGPPLISLDSGLAKGFGIGLGDSLTLNVLGRNITAKVTSLRDINWRQLRFDFAIIVSPGVLEGAPHSHIAAVHVPKSDEKAIDQALAKDFDNVSIIRVRDALDQAATLVDGIGWAVKATAIFTLISGALVLAGAVAATHRRRTFETVVFKVLGAGKKRLFGLFLAEYGLLSIATTIVATVLGILISWAVTTFLMRLDWTLSAEPIVLASGISLIAVLGLGLWGTARALEAKPLSHLRNP